MKPKSAFLLGLVFTMALFFLSGCSTPFRKGSEPIEKPQAVSQEGRPFSLPFLGDDVRGAGDVIIRNIQPLIRISSVSLGTSAVFWLLLGYKVGIGLALGGFTGLGVSVLFTEYPRTVLFVFALALLVLIGWGIWHLYRRIRNDPGS